MKMFWILDLYRFNCVKIGTQVSHFTLNVRDTIFSMIVTILNFVCVANCIQQNVSFHVKCGLYQVEMGCKMFPHKAVISL